jgi:hypothetical protein
MGCRLQGSQDKGGNKMADSFKGIGHDFVGSPSRTRTTDMVINSNSLHGVAAISSAFNKLLMSVVKSCVMTYLKDKVWLLHFNGFHCMLWQKGHFKGHSVEDVCLQTGT